MHVVTWNDSATIARCIEAVATQQGFVFGDSLRLRITDNNSSDGTVDIVRRALGPSAIALFRNQANLGFCGAHNQAITELLSENFDALLVLNPDVRLESDTLARMCEALSLEERVGMVTPKLLRASCDLEPIEPAVIDAAGMALYPSLRHLDRGSGERDTGQYMETELVFGGTGACLLLSVECIRALLIPNTVRDEPVFEMYPQLREGHATRLKIFDEAFFAYREDADLSGRARRAGWKCRYTPNAVAYHVRAVTPEKRAELPPEINLYSVRNRFLLQLNNWSFNEGFQSFVQGVVLRNFIVCCGVLLKERSSLAGLVQAWKLVPRAVSIRASLKASRPRSEGNPAHRATPRAQLSAPLAPDE